VDFVEHAYLLAKAGRSNGRWNGRQLKGVDPSEIFFRHKWERPMLPKG
jgi:hypothetical protein